MWNFIPKAIKDASSYHIYKKNLDRPQTYWTKFNSKNRPVWYHQNNQIFYTFSFKFLEVLLFVFKFCV